MVLTLSDGTAWLILTWSEDRLCHGRVLKLAIALRNKFLRISATNVAIESACLPSIALLLDDQINLAVLKHDFLILMMHTQHRYRMVRLRILEALEVTYSRSAGPTNLKIALKVLILTRTYSHIGLRGLMRALKVATHCAAELILLFVLHAWHVGTALIEACDLELFAHHFLSRWFGLCKVFW